MMYGDKRPYNVALVTLRVVGYTGEVAGTNELDKVIWKGLDCEADCTTIEELMAKDEEPPVIKAIIEAITKTNANKLCVPSNPCKVQKFTILKKDFSVEFGELTPTLKLKRSVVSKKYEKVVDA